MTSGVTGAFVQSQPVMGTTLTITAIGHDATDAERSERERCVRCAAAWFLDVEATCSRFDERSEVRRLLDRVGEAVRVSPMLLNAVEFALAVAAATDGAFDPTIGAQMEARGFVHEHRTGAAVTSSGLSRTATYRDVEIDRAAETITLHERLMLDLGAVAKGLAIDLAARELAPLVDFSIEAGGDLFLGGHNEHGDPWTIGVRDPFVDEIIETIRVRDRAVCTSGGYERPVHVAGARQHHLLDPRTGASPREIASVTVVGLSAMTADALSTAAFVLGAQAGVSLLTRHGVEGLIVMSDGGRSATPGWWSLAEQRS